MRDGLRRFDVSFMQSEGSKAMMFVLQLLGVYLIFMYLVMPLFVLKNNKMPARYKLEPIKDKVQFFVGQDELHIQYHLKIQTLGFSYLGSGQFTNEKTHTSFSLYRNADLGLHGGITSMQSTAMSLTYAEFTQLYDEDTVLSINNSSVDEIYPKTSLKTTLSYPDVHDLETLLAIAKPLVARLNTDKKKFFYDGDDYCAFLESFFNRELDDLIEQGYANDAVVDGQRSLTLKGAYLMSWKVLWPIKQLRHTLLAKQAKKALEQSGYSA